MKKIVYLLAVLFLVACSAPEEVVVKKPELSPDLMLAKIRDLTPMVLEGPIRVGSPGQKAAVWVQFELIN